MKTIRFGVFETNSSSTHSLTIVSKEDYDAWEEGKLLFDRWNKIFVPVEEKDTYEDPEDLYTIDEYDDIDMEPFRQTYKTKNGDEIVAFGYYGYDS